MGKSNQKNQLGTERQRNGQDSLKEEDFKARKQRKELHLMKMSQEWDARRQKRRLDRQKWLEERKTQNLPIWKKVGNLRVQVNDVQGGQIMRHDEGRDAYSDFTETNLNTVATFRADKPMSVENSIGQTLQIQPPANKTQIALETKATEEIREGQVGKTYKSSESPKTVPFVRVKTEQTDRTNEEISDSRETNTTAESSSDGSAESVQILNSGNQELAAHETAPIRPKSGQRTPGQMSPAVSMPTVSPAAHLKRTGTEWKQLSDLHLAVPPVVFEDYIKRQGEVEVLTLDNRYQQQRTTEGYQIITNSTVINVNRPMKNSSAKKGEEMSHSFPQIKTCYSLQERNSSTDSVEVVVPRPKDTSNNSRLAVSVEPGSLTALRNGGYVVYVRDKNIKHTRNESTQQLKYTVPTFGIPSKTLCYASVPRKMVDSPQPIYIKEEPGLTDDGPASPKDSQHSSSGKADSSPEEPREKRARYNSSLTKHSPSIVPCKSNEEDQRSPPVNGPRTASPGHFIRLHEMQGKESGNAQDNKSRFAVKVRLESNEEGTEVNSRSAIITSHKTRIRELAEFSVQKHLSKTLPPQQHFRPQKQQHQQKCLDENHEQQQKRVHRRKEEVQQLKRQKEQHHLQRLRREEQQLKQQLEMQQFRVQQEQEKDKCEQTKLHERPPQSQGLHQIRHNNHQYLVDEQKHRDQQQNFTRYPSLQQQQQQKQQQKMQRAHEHQEKYHREQQQEQQQQKLEGQKHLPLSQQEQTEKKKQLQLQQHQKQQTQQQKQLQSSEQQISEHQRERQESQFTRTSNKQQTFSTDQKEPSIIVKHLAEQSKQEPSVIVRDLAKPSRQEPSIIVKHLAEPSKMPSSQEPQLLMNTSLSEQNNLPFSNQSSSGTIHTPSCRSLSSSKVTAEQPPRYVGPDIAFNPMSTYVRSKLVPREIVIPPQVGSLRAPVVEYIKTDMICEEELTHWTAKNVADFILATDCSDHADIFLEQEIDGKALLLLTQDMLTKGMSLKLGPAMKLYNHICNLRAALVMHSQLA